MSELETMGELIWLKRMLESGRAKTLVKNAGFTTAAVGRIVGLAQPNAWAALAGKQFPRRAAALKLASLLHHLEVLNAS